MYSVKLSQRAIPEGGSHVTRKRLGLGQLRYVLGDGATEGQARRVYALLHQAGLLDDAGELDGHRIVGLAEFAEIMNRTPQAVRGWRIAPEPVVRIKSGPIWDRFAVEAFKAEHPELCGVRADA